LKATCKYCKTKFEQKIFNLRFCRETTECEGAAVSFIIEKKRKADLKEWTREKKVLKEKLKTLSDWKKDLQTEINTIVRLIDKDKPCIATGNFGKMNAGHRFSVGSNPTLRFHLDNIHVQSEHSNKWKAGDTIRYDEGLEKIYGKKYLNHVRTLNNIKPINLTVEDLKEKIKIARQIVKYLKLEDSVYSDVKRLELRNQFNLMLKIYL
jgi:hypothetical protein